MARTKFRVSFDFQIHPTITSSIWFYFKLLAGYVPWRTCQEKNCRIFHSARTGGPKIGLYTPINLWLVVWNSFYVPIYWDLSSQFTNSFFDEGLKPPTRSILYISEWFSLDFPMDFPSKSAPGPFSGCGDRWPPGAQGCWEFVSEAGRFV